VEYLKEAQFWLCTKEKPNFWYEKWS
jgi:hypothetical protein